MSTKVIGDYTAAATIDGSTHYLLIQPGSSSTAYKKINRNVFLGVSGQPMDISSSQSVTNKTLDNTNTVTFKDTLFTLQDDGDVTKQAKFQLSGITTATTRTYILPNASSTIADISTTQTFTNKTLTSPVISGGSIDNATVTVDAIAGHTTANSGTIYGIAVTSSKISGTAISNATITSTQLANGAVTASKLATGAAGASVATAETTASTGYTDLATTTDTVTVTIGANGFALVTLNSLLQNTTAGAQAWMSFAVSGATTQAASDTFSIEMQAYANNAQETQGGVFFLTGLAAGSTTFKAKYRASANTAQFQFRRIAVIPL